MKRILMSMSLLATLGLNAWGQEKLPAPTPMKPMAGVMSEVQTETVSETHAEQAQSPYLLERLRPKAIVESWKAKKEARGPVGCYSHFNDYSCDSCHSTCQFMFGSCRTFFGEACLKGPPPSPVPGFDAQALGLDPRGRAKCANCR